MSAPQPVPRPSVPFLTGVLFLVATATGRSQIWFEDRTAAAGVDWQGISFGAGAWCDYDRDGDPDLYDPHHYFATTDLFENLGDGTFARAADQVFFDPMVDRVGDFHGPVWADFDNDGDRDLYVAHGSGRGSSANRSRLFVNLQGQLVDLTTAFGAEFSGGRSRTPLWLPYNELDHNGQHDRLLDLFVTTQQRADGIGPTGLLLAAAPDPRFYDVTPVLGLPPQSNVVAALSDLSGDGRLDLVLPSFSDLKVYALNTAPLQDISAQLSFPSRGGVDELVTGDFDGNGLMDVFVASNFERSGHLFGPDGELEVSLVRRNDQQGVAVTTQVMPGHFEIELDSFYFDLADVRIGAGGRAPGAPNFRIDFSDGTAYGMVDFTPGTDHGLYIGIDPASRELELRASSTGFYRLGLTITTPHPFGNVRPIGYDLDEEGPSNSLYLAEPDGAGGVRFQDRIGASGLPVMDNTASAAAGDFDNDGDLDLFTMTFCRVRNGDNRHRLWANRGDGTFQEVPLAGGIRSDPRGRADAVSVVDYDRDGALDLYLTNGEGEEVFGREGRSQLYRNLGPIHGWLLVELEGTRSNRDGLGARVTAHVGNRKLIREQNGGVHRYTQDDTSALHFGLGMASSVRKLVIEWPSGTRQVLRDIARNQRIQVVEP